MYFIDEGSVVVILNETSQVILTVGQYFGEVQSNLIKRLL